MGGLLEGKGGGHGGWAAVMIDDRAGIGNHLLYNPHPPGGYEPFTLVRAAVMIALLSVLIQTPTASVIYQPITLGGRLTYYGSNLP